MGYCNVKDQWNSSRVSYKNGEFLSGMEFFGMKINLYQNLQG